MKMITLTQGYVALVDDADYEAVNAFNWHASKQGQRWCARRNVVSKDGKWGYQNLHRFLLPEAPRIDHRDGNTLNNQRSNIRPATAQQNGRGFRRKKCGASSIYRGVCRLTTCDRWQANIRINGKLVYLGIFKSEMDAARAYDTAARENFGDFASPNFPL